MITVKTREQAQTLRKAVTGEFSKLRPWVCVHIQAENKFGIEVSSYWGGVLPEKDAQTIETFLMQKAAEISAAATTSAKPAAIPVPRDKN